MEIVKILEFQVRIWLMNKNFCMLLFLSPSPAQHLHTI